MLSLPRASHDSGTNARTRDGRMIANAQDRALIEEIGYWLAPPSVLEYMQDRPVLERAEALKDLLTRARDALLAHEQQRSQAAATFTDKSGGERCITCGRMAPAADPPRDDSNAEWRRLTYEAQEQSRRDAQDAKRYRWLRAR